MFSHILPVLIFSLFIFFFPFTFSLTVWLLDYMPVSQLQLSDSCRSKSLTPGLGDIKTRTLHCPLGHLCFHFTVHFWCLVLYRHLITYTFKKVCLFYFI